SELRTFYVGTLPCVDEKEPNNNFEQFQQIDLNVTVHGVIDNEDVDCFSVELKKDQRLSVAVEGLRLGRTMFDPHVAIFDSKEKEFTACDDHPLVRQDCLASIVAPADGTYYVRLRESTFAGNGDCNYRLHIGTFPMPTTAVPL